jgi:ATP-dependent Clp protease ATP-binding subunit ClpB
LDEKQIEQIVDLQLNELQERLHEKRITLVVDEAAKKHLAKEGYNPDFGARPLKRLLQHEILDELALQILEGKIKDGQKVTVSLEKGKIKIQ